MSRLIFVLLFLDRILYTLTWKMTETWTLCKFWLPTGPVTNSDYIIIHLLGIHVIFESLIVAVKKWVNCHSVSKKCDVQTECLTPTVRGSSGSVMLLQAFCWHGLGPFVPIDWRVTARQYKVALRVTQCIRY